MPYDKKPSAPAGSDLWPVDGNLLFEAVIFADGTPRSTLPLVPADFVSQLPPNITHVTIVPTGGTPGGATSTWVEVASLTSPACDYLAAAGVTACAATGLQIIDVYVSTDSGVTPLHYAQPYFNLQDSSGACSGP